MSVPTSDPLDPQTLEAIRARLTKITPGPWAWESIAEKSNEFAVGTAFDANGKQLSGRLPEGEWVEDAVIERRGVVGLNESGHANFDDADFIAHAPVDIRDLLAALTALTDNRDAWALLATSTQEKLTALTQAHARVTAAISDKREQPIDFYVNLAKCYRQDSELLDDCDQHADGPTLREVITRLRQRIAALEAALAAQDWQPIETAAKGTWLDGPNDTRHPDYIEPPKVWVCLNDGSQCLAYADAYYAEGGSGFDGGSYWVETFSGERVTPVKWRPLPLPPGDRAQEGT